METIRIIIKAGMTRTSQPAASDCIDDLDALKRTALHWAAIRGSCSAIKELRKFNPGKISNKNKCANEEALNYPSVSFSIKFNLTIVKKQLNGKHFMLS